MGVCKVLSFFKRCPDVSGQVWERFYSLYGMSLEKIKNDQESGLVRSHTVEIVNSLMNNPREYFDYDAYEYTCSKNDLYESFNNLKKILYINENPFNEDGSSLKYGEVSINNFKVFDDVDDIQDKDGFKRTLRFMLSKRGYLFYKYGIDWVRAVLRSLEGDKCFGKELGNMLKSEKDEDLDESLVYLLDSKEDLIGCLRAEELKNEWVYEG